MSDYVGTIAATRYRLYLKQEERKRTVFRADAICNAAILWLIKLIAYSLEKTNLKS
ncbi:MAG: hypothetical protein WCF23_08050 [Candidatus Nitrosopolaris sp.]